MNADKIKVIKDRIIDAIGRDDAGTHECFAALGVVIGGLAVALGSETFGSNIACALNGVQGGSEEMAKLMKIAPPKFTMNHSGMN